MERLGGSSKRMRPGRTRWAMVLFCLLSSLLGMACGPGLEDSVAKLGGSVEEREEGHQELLLAKDRAVEPLLAALEEERYSEARPELVEVLVGLMTRVSSRLCCAICATIPIHACVPASPAGWECTSPRSTWNRCWQP